MFKNTLKIETLELTVKYLQKKVKVVNMQQS